MKYCTIRENCALEVIYLNMIIILPVIAVFSPPATVHGCIFQYPVIIETSVHKGMHYNCIHFDFWSSRQWLSAFVSSASVFH